MNLVTDPQTVFLSNTLSLLAFFPSLSSFVSYSLSLFTLFFLLLMPWDFGCEVELDQQLRSEWGSSSMRDQLATYPSFVFPSSSYEELGLTHKVESSLCFPLHCYSQGRYLRATDKEKDRIAAYSVLICPFQFDHVIRGVWKKFKCFSKSFLTS